MMATLLKKQPIAETSIHPETRMGHISLTVDNLENQITFYEQALGFQLHWRAANTAGLGAGEVDLLQLVEQPNIKRYQRVTGLYHFAVLYPDRHEFARAIARLFALKIPNYPTDHIMTKSTYLNDPEGNGIELYAESPEDGEWFMEDGDFYARRSDGSLSNGREPLDTEELFRHLDRDNKFEGSIPQAARIGHVHLHTRDIDESVDFYHNLIGFDVMGVIKTIQMAFVSAGGYHHHLGLNTWQGEGAPPPPPDAKGLRYFSIVLPNKVEMDKILSRLESAGLPLKPYNEGVKVYDPSRNGLLLTS